jgi:Na+/melibiose symporter-like transporter
VIIDPIYTDWIRYLFPHDKMGKLSGIKDTILNIFSIVPVVFAAYILDSIKSNETLIGFTILFVCAGIFRFISSRFLNKMHATEDKDALIKETKKMSTRPIFRIFKREVLKDKEFKKFLIFIILFYFGLYIGTSYFPYMLLSVLHYSYSNYIIYTIAYTLGFVFSLTYWGYVADKYGPIKILKTTVVFIPFCLIVEYFFVNNLAVLAVLQFFFGVVFAGFYFAVVQYFYKNIKEDVINHIAFYYIFTSFAMVLGSLLGSLIISIGKKYYTELFALFLVFAVSAVFRFIAAIYGHGLKDQNKRNINLYSSILFQKPVIYSVKHFGYVLSEEEKKVVSEIKKEEIKIFNKIRE